ncbi:hypothetical protein PALI_a2331 [Pseudoalteromonas aliena SW19]|uniref:Uncharacterized protein n=1 Tax=Pseudoalteromonas aliena SW19 TaxID=1314866 RepID=A0ABR9E1U4_9GAMM|nr:hypothetical protein [Pseudoalteromonas aliena SW19]
MLGILASYMSYIFDAIDKSWHLIFAHCMCKNSRALMFILNL